MNIFQSKINKRRMSNRLSFLRSERETVRKALDDTAVVPEVEVVEAEEIVQLLPAPDAEVMNFRRVTVYGAAEAYNAIRESNYLGLVKGMGHLEKDMEFTVAMCLVDRCEEFGDYKAMVSAFSILEYVVRLSKSNSETLVFARRYIISMRKYLTEQGVL